MQNDVKFLECDYLSCVTVLETHFMCTQNERTISEETFKPTLISDFTYKKCVTPFNAEEMKNV